MGGLFFRRRGARGREEARGDGGWAMGMVKGYPCIARSEAKGKGKRGWGMVPEGRGVGEKRRPGDKETKRPLVPEQ